MLVSKSLSLMDLDLDNLLILDIIVSDSLRYQNNPRFYDIAKERNLLE